MGSSSIIHPYFRFGLATGARKMIDSEYEHAEQSLKTGIYVPHILLRADHLLERAEKIRMLQVGQALQMFLRPQNGWPRRLILRQEVQYRLQIVCMQKIHVCSY